MTETSSPRPLLRGRWLMAGHAAWAALVVPTLGLTAWGMVLVMQDPMRFRTPEIAEVTRVLGFSDRIGVPIFMITPFVFFVITAVVLFWRRSTDGMVMLSGVALVSLGAIGGRWLLVVGDARPQTAWAVRIVELVGVGSFVLVLSLFPDGRFVPGWTRLLPIAAVVAVVLMPDFVAVYLRSVYGGLPESYPVWRRWLPASILNAFYVAAFVGQVQRYRRHSGPLERQQAKWVGFSLASVTLVVLLGQVVRIVPGEAGSRLSALSLPVGSVALVLFQVALAIAIFRYRLFDIDRIISRTLSYAIVTALLGAVFAVFVLVPTLVVGSDDVPDYVIAAATLVVAASFRLVRRRVQGIVDRRFNRARYDAQRTIESFTQRLRGQIDIDALGAELRDVVRRTMQPTHLSVWLKGMAPR